VLGAILWVLRTGAPWRDLPERFGPWSTAWNRFRRWTAAGVWQRVLEALQRQGDRAGDLDWETHYVDATVVRAHQHAAGAIDGQEHEALGRSRGGFSTKVHVRAEGGGRPMALVVSAGERHESLYVEALLAAGRVRRTGRGRPRVRPGQLVGDKGYSYRSVRGVLAGRGIRAVIPYRRNQRPGDRRHRPFDLAAYRGRNRVERLINRLKQGRRVATRYEKRAAHYLAMLTLAALRLWSCRGTLARCATEPHFGAAPSQGRRTRLREGTWLTRAGAT
jgi:transposase